MSTSRDHGMPNVSWKAYGRMRTHLEEVTVKRILLQWLITIAALFASSGAEAGYSSLFVFGDSLSDSGNNAIALAPNVTPVPISGNTFIPTYPYASGQYTNDKVWAQFLASSLGLSADPSLAGGTDWAFGGATTGPVSSDLLAPFPPSLETQAAFFLLQNGNTAPSSALYVVAGGGNDARDALGNIMSCNGNLGCIQGIIQSTAATFAMNIGTIVGELESAGAQNIAVWNTPDVGKAPAVLAQGAGAAAVASLLAFDMNAALLQAIGSDPDVRLFDLYGLLDSIIGDPAAFGLTDVTNACAQFSNCDPSTYLFWDGIHPTSAGQQIIADAMHRLTVPEPTTVALFGIGLAGLGFSRRRKRTR
jgi:outer membrane lipase/esterase